MPSGAKQIDITGQKFGKLTIIKFSHKDDCNQYLWLAICDCGKERLVPSNLVRYGKIKSCGCLHTYKDNMLEKVIKRHFSELE